MVQNSGGAVLAPRKVLGPPGGGRTKSHFTKPRTMARRCDICHMTDVYVNSTIHVYGWSHLVFLFLNGQYSNLVCFNQS